MTFVGKLLPERLYLQYISYRAKPYKRAPWCFCCQSYGHIAALCSENRVHGRYGKEKCNKYCEERQVKAKCVHCVGEHYTGSTQCPRRENGVKMSKIRAKCREMSYAEAIKRVERDDNKTCEREVNFQQEPERKRNVSGQSICMDKKRFFWLLLQW